MSNNNFRLHTVTRNILAPERIVGDDQQFWSIRHRTRLGVQQEEKQRNKWGRRDHDDATSAARGNMGRCELSSCNRESDREGCTAHDCVYNLLDVKRASRPERAPIFARVGIADDADHHSPL